MRQITLKCEEMPLNMLTFVLKNAKKCPPSVINALKMSLKCEKNVRKKCEKNSLIMLRNVLKYAKFVLKDAKKMSFKCEKMSVRNAEKCA